MRFLWKVCRLRQTSLPLKKGRITLKSACLYSEYTIMILFITTILLVGLSYAQNQSPVVDPNKFTICAITINSDNEKKVFESQVKKYPKKFNPVVELTTMGTEDEDGDDWFDMACKSGLRCDQLVISGHFGGTFFGDTDKELSMEELESKGCSKTCEGIMAQPYEVFLFGCNTLASKEQDRRTPGQYLQVLLSDGIPRPQAEMVVETRYGTTGDDFKSSMQRAFHGNNKQLYGFDSIGPSGKNVEGFLKNYFSKIKAPEHLEKLQAKRMMNQVEMGNSALANSLKSTAFTQCLGGETNDPASNVICKLRDENLSVDKKMDVLLEALSNENFLVFVPAINSFLKDHPIAKMDEINQKKITDIQNNEVLKRQILGLLSTKNLTMAYDWSGLANSLGIMNTDERNTYLSEKVLPLFDDGISRDEIDMVCSMFNRWKNPLAAFPVEKIKRKLKNSDLEAFKCMGVDGPKLTESMIAIFGDKEIDFALVQDLLSGRAKDTPEIKEKLLNSILSNPIDSQSSKRSLYFVSMDMIRDAAFQKRVLKSVDGSENSEQMAIKINAINELVSRYPDPKNMELILDTVTLVIKSPKSPDFSNQTGDVSKSITKILFSMDKDKFSKKDLLRILDLYETYPKKIPRYLINGIKMSNFRNDPEIKKRLQEATKAYNFANEIPLDD